MSVQKRRALIIWLTDVAETAGIPDVIEQAAAMASRHVVLFAVMRHPEMQSLVTSSPEDVPQMCG